MQTKIKYLKAYLTDFISRLRDIRFAGQVIFVIIVLLISWSGVKAIRLNYNLQKQIATAKAENTVQELENQNLQLENEYYNSNQYLELQARQNFGLADPGETEVLIPQNVALAYAPKLTSENDQTSQIQTPQYQSNVQSWVNFLLNRR